jgi:hypothetical protein
MYNKPFKGLLFYGFFYSAFSTGFNSAYNLLWMLFKIAVLLPGKILLPNLHRRPTRPGFAKEIHIPIY